LIELKVIQTNKLMSFTKLLISYILTAVVFFAVDMLWLGLIARNFYNKYLASFLAEHVNWTAAIIFYLLFIAGVFVFVIMPAIEKNSLWRAVAYGAMFGFITYATYDLTNLATLKNWPLTIVLVDITWGAVLTAIVAASGYSIMKWLD
jgi:uncharacterized membrane protein